MKELALFLLTLALALTSYRLLRGPSLPDRVLGLEMVGFGFMGLALVYALLTRQVFFVDVATVLALVSFLATIAFARFIERSRE
ncbi:monovalent cation/H+ antiporter complex subunit F [Thermus tengchongensis]|uniref:Pesticidal protein Cry22Aa n=1 Tax=Thermus tengchongensis TaxID=1214928 RepID=A0A4Y9EXP7_9DEIN|nr:monovalent cation/H+ antiporter complex subunit F [Thermus tengchongensis]TFU17106.1 pesticidal protein Cry22Aa [Thermus tengchongensis]TFU27230.1 pesticidal protein Cry22Aa [Thermus tengchongensis]